MAEAACPSLLGEFLSPAFAMTVSPSLQGMGSGSLLHLQSGPFTKVPCAPIAANIPNTMSSSLPQNSWGKVLESSLGRQDSPTQGNAGPYLVLQLANQLGQPVNLSLQPLCLGVRGTCTEPGDSDGVRGTCRHPPRALCCCWDLSAPSHPRQPALTSLEALSLLPGDHPGGGRVAGCRVVIPGVTQAVTILAGVVPATREHTGCQDSRAGHAQGASTGSLFLVPLPTIPDPLESNSAHCAQAVQASFLHHPSASASGESRSETQECQWAAPSSHHFSFLLMEQHSPPSTTSSLQGLFLS